MESFIGIGYINRFERLCSCVLMKYLEKDTELNDRILLVNAGAKLEIAEFDKFSEYGLDDIIRIKYHPIDAHFYECWISVVPNIITRQLSTLMLGVDYYIMDANLDRHDIECDFQGFIIKARYGLPVGKKVEFDTWRNILDCSYVFDRKYNELNKTKIELTHEQYDYLKKNKFSLTGLNISFEEE